MRDGAAMPPLDPAPPLSRFEFWPASLFYLPMIAVIGALAVRHRGLRLPLLANPGLPAGGLVGESKSAVFAALQGPERAAFSPYVTLRRRGSAVAQLAEAEHEMWAGGLDYPVVAKPDIGCRGAGVRPVRNSDELIAYLADFPVGETVILQRLVAAEGEAGIFYVRAPGEDRGQILSLTLKYFPHVTGDGRSTIEALILADPRAGQVPHLYLPRLRDRLRDVPGTGEHVPLVFAGNHCRGAIFRDGTAHVTRALIDRMDRIAACIPAFISAGSTSAFRISRRSGAART